MDLLLKQLQFSLSITGPICLMLFLGVYFRRSHLINDNFIEVASRLVFRVTLPALLFFSIIDSNHDLISSGAFVFYSIVSNFIFFIFITLLVKRLFTDPADQGVIIQGAFRSNTAIIALAYITNMYGTQGLATAALYVAGQTLLFNIQAVYTLAPVGQACGTSTLRITIKTLTKNPLIIAILLGVLFAQLSIPVPDIAIKAGHYFANMTLPLALICAGGSLDLHQMRYAKKSATAATAFKLLLCPIVITLGGFICGFEGMQLGIIFFASSAPAAAASYIMARAMGGNATLAANIIVLTTLFSLITTTLGIFILTFFALI